MLAMQVPLQSFGVVPEQEHALLVHVLPPVHSLEEQQAVLAMQAPLHNFVVPEQTHWLLVHAIPPVQSADEQQAEVRMHALPHCL